MRIYWVEALEIEYPRIRWIVDWKLELYLGVHFLSSWDDILATTLEKPTVNNDVEAPFWRTVLSIDLA